MKSFWIAFLLGTLLTHMYIETINRREIETRLLVLEVTVRNRL